MPDTNLVSAVSALYEAAVVPDAWQAALGAVANASSASMAQLLVWNRLSDRQDSSLVWNIDPAAEKSYAQYYGEHDPHRRIVMDYPYGNVMLNHEVFDYEYIESNMFYQEFLVRAGGGYIAAIRLNEFEGNCDVILGLHRKLKEGPFLYSSQNSIFELRAHLLHATALYKRLEPLRAQYRAATRVIDQMTQAAVIVGRQGKVVILNKACQSFLDKTAHLKICQGKLIGNDLSIAGVLTRSVSEALKPIAKQRVVSAFQLPGDKHNEQTNVIIIPLPEQNYFMLANEPVALILIEHSGSRRFPAPALLRQLFGLTPAEAAVVTALLLGKRVEEVAAERSVAMPTLRSQLRSILDKTNCSRQSELIRLIGPLSTFKTGRTD